MVECGDGARLAPQLYIGRIPPAPIAVLIR
jgi:hypothetical protein